MSVGSLPGFVSLSILSAGLSVVVSDGLSMSSAVSSVSVLVGVSVCASVDSGL